MFTAVQSKSKTGCREKFCFAHDASLSHRNARAASTVEKECWTWQPAFKVFWCPQNLTFPPTPHDSLLHPPWMHSMLGWRASANIPRLKVGHLNIYLSYQVASGAMRAPSVGDSRVRLFDDRQWYLFCFLTSWELSNALQINYQGKRKRKRTLKESAWCGVRDLNFVSQNLNLQLRTNHNGDRAKSRKKLRRNETFFQDRRIPGGGGNWHKSGNPLPARGQNRKTCVLLLIYFLLPTKQVLKSFHLCSDDLGLRKIWLPHLFVLKARPQICESARVCSGTKQFYFYFAKR